MDRKVPVVRRKTDWSTENCKQRSGWTKLSAFRALEDKLERLIGVVDTLRRKVEEIIPRNDEFNSVYYEKIRRSPIEGPIPMDDLIVFDESLDGRKVRVLKDNGCNTNVVSLEFFEKNCK